MSDKFQLPHSIKVLHDAIVIHLADFKNVNSDEFDYRRESAEFGIEYFKFRFARVLISTRWNWKARDLGFIRLRRLNRSLTEMFIEDAPGLHIGPEIFVNADYVRFGDDDQDDDGKGMSLKQRRARAAEIFERFKTIHTEVRHYIVQGLHDDQLLQPENGESSKVSNRRTIKSSVRRRVFISYAHEDIESARRIYQQLKAVDGLDPWFDKESLLPGIKWRPAIKKAIRESDFFIALLSNKSTKKRGYVQTEMKEALEIWDQFPEDKPYLIPVRLNKCHPSYEKLREVQFQDLFPSWDQGFERVLQVITSTGTSHSSSRVAVSKGYEYRCAVVDLDNGLANLPQVCQRLNSIQNFFHFSYPVFPFEHTALRTFEGHLNLYVPDLPESFYGQKTLLNADVAVCLTKYLLAFEEEEEAGYDYLSLPSDDDDTFNFVTTYGLYENAKKAGCTFEKSFVYHILTQLLIHFSSDLGFHSEVRGCILDYCDKHSWMIKGMKRMRLCRNCAKSVENVDLKKAVLAILADPITV